MFRKLYRSNIRDLIEREPDNRFKLGVDWWGQVSIVIVPVDGPVSDSGVSAAMSVERALSTNNICIVKLFPVATNVDLGYTLYINKDRTSHTCPKKFLFLCY